MINHIFIPEVDFSTLRLLPEHREWITEWLREVEKDIENGVVSSALCLNGLMAEILLYGRGQTNWQEILNKYLLDSNGGPLTYSEEYGKKLYRFSQWKQTPVHAVHAHWWIEKFYGTKDEKLSTYSDLIKGFVQPNGWIYNPKVSPTGIRTRMKSELMMSLAMGLEILDSLDSLSEQKHVFEAVLSSAPMSGYLSAEYFRLRSLQILNRIGLAPSCLSEVFEPCKAGEGYCDFSVDSKVDDYMGTQKRTSRDKAVHSAISSLHAQHVSRFCGEYIQISVGLRLKNFGRYLFTNPFDIPAFKMRDIDIPFGTELSPLEIMGASYITSIGK